MTLRTGRRALIGVLAAAALAVAAAPAGASSVVYVKDGNVWLTDPDGAKQYQVTFDGGYSSPSQADDGTIVALRARQFVRMDRSGRQLNAPVDGIGTDPGGGQFYGPWEPKVSPDGRRIAYWFGQYSEYYNSGCNCYLFHLENLSTWTWADHFKPYTDDGQYKGLESPSWLTGDRLLATYSGFHENVWTWKLDSGHANYDAQWAFSVQDSEGTYYDFGDAEVSPDGSRFAATAGGDATTNDQLFVGTTNGPLWVGEPPYDNGLSPLPAQPDLRCGGTLGKIVSPTWAPDSREVAYSLGDGVHVLGAGDLADCRALTDRTIAPGGSEPDWGPADVDPSKAPSPPKAAGPSGGSQESGPRTTKLALTGVKLRPRAFAAARRGPGVIAARAGTTLRYRLSEPARLTLTVRHAGRHGRKVRGQLKTAGRPGVNGVRLTGRIARHSLAPGRYKLRIAARDLTRRERAAATVSFRITRR
jgi:hypothetical protein